MPAPRVFVSSTWYDLRHIRENLKFFIRTLGYEPVMSEEGAIFYDPRMHVQDACITEVPSCQVLVLIIGGRYGSLYQDSGGSITNEEYKSAVKAKIPIFALVERGVLDDYRVFKANTQNSEINVQAIKYPAVDSTKIFGFIDEVQTQVVNNALFQFSDFEEMQAYLKQQWASMLHRYLTSEGEARRTADILEALAKANERIEFLTRRIVDSVGSRLAKVSVRLYDLLLNSEVAHDLSCWSLPVSPKRILQAKTFDVFCNGQIEVDKDSEKEYSLTYGGPPYRLSSGRYKANAKNYGVLRQSLEAALKEAGVSLEDYLNSDEP
jgi:hypothetical protein